MLNKFKNIGDKCCKNMKLKRIMANMYVPIAVRLIDMTLNLLIFMIMDIR